MSDFVWRSFDLGESRLALTSPGRRPVEIRPAVEIARVFHTLPSEPDYARRAPRIERADAAVLARLDAMAETPGKPPIGGLAAIEDACSVAGGVLIAASGAVVKESLGNTEARFGPFRRRSDGALTARVWPMTPMKRFSGDFIFLRQAGDGDYGRWLIEVLPRLAIAAQFCDLSQFKIVVSRQTDAMAAIVRDSLALFGVRPEQIVAIGERPIFFQRLIFPLPVAEHPCAKSPQAIEVLESYPARLPGSRDAPKRIYVTAGPGEKRPANEAEILDELWPLGFTGLDPSRMSFAERVRIFSRAEQIVGVAGAGLGNAAFAPRGVRVLALTAPGVATDAFLCDLTDVKQGSFFSLHGDHGRDFFVDFASFEAMLLDFF